MLLLQQRRNYVLASNLLLLGLGMSYLVLVARWMLGINTAKPMRWPNLTYGATVFSFLLMTWLYYAVRSGKRWTRVLLLVLFVGSLLMNLAYPQKIKTDPLNIISWVVYLITHIWGLVLLFQRPQPIN